jgi:hypothetical protein
MASKRELEDIVQRQTAALKLQMDRIAELEAEFARLNEVISGDCDALQTLQRIYTDPANPVSVIMKAAGEAVAYERAKPPSVAINAGVSLYDVLEKKRLERFQPAVIDAKPDPASRKEY